MVSTQVELGGDHGTLRSRVKDEYSLNWFKILYKFISKWYTHCILNELSMIFISQFYCIIPPFETVPEASFQKWVCRINRKHGVQGTDHFQNGKMVCKVMLGRIFFFFSPVTFYISGLHYFNTNWLHILWFYVYNWHCCRSLFVAVQKLSFGKIGFSKAMSNKWIRLDKGHQGGPRIFRNVCVKPFLKTILKILSRSCS